MFDMGWAFRLLDVIYVKIPITQVEIFFKYIILLRVILGVLIKLC